jgi:hypothetical protein
MGMPRAVGVAVVLLLAALAATVAACGGSAANPASDLKGMAPPPLPAEGSASAATDPLARLRANPAFRAVAGDVSFEVTASGIEEGTDSWFHLRFPAPIPASDGPWFNGHCRGTRVTQFSAHYEEVTGLWVTVAASGAIVLLTPGVDADAEGRIMPQGRAVGEQRDITVRDRSGRVIWEGTRWLRESDPGFARMVGRTRCPDGFADD